MDSNVTTTLEQRLIAICQTVRNEALDPALKEAEAIRLGAEQGKEEILESARKKAQEIIRDAEQRAKEIQRMLDMSLMSASKQALGVLQEKIEKELFQPALSAYVERSLQSEKGTADLIKALIAAIEAQGIFGDVSVEIGNFLSKEKVTQALGVDVLNKLKNGHVEIGPHHLGIILRMKGQHIVLDVSEKAVQELMSGFVRQEFRKFLFADESLS